MYGFWSEIDVKLSTEEKKCHACLMTQMKSPMSKKAAATPTTPIELASYATHTNTEKYKPIESKKRDK